MSAWWTPGSSRDAGLASVGLQALVGSARKCPRAHLTGVVSVGAAGFEPTTSCTQIPDETVAGSINGSQPSVIVRDPSRVTFQSSQPLADFRKRFGSPVVPAGRGERAEQPTVPSLHLVQSTRNPLLTAKEVADVLRVCSATVHKLCDSGALPHVRVLNAVRVEAADLEKFMAGRKSR